MSYQGKTEQGILGEQPGILYFSSIFKMLKRKM